MVSLSHESSDPDKHKQQRPKCETVRSLVVKEQFSRGLSNERKIGDVINVT